MSGSQGLALGGKGMEDDARAGLGGEFAKDRELRLLARTALVVVCGDITSCLTGVVEHQHPVGSSIFASQSLSPTPRGAGAGDFYDRALGPSRAADVAGREAVRTGCCGRTGTIQAASLYGAMEVAGELTHELTTRGTCPLKHSTRVSTKVKPAATPPR